MAVAVTTNHYNDDDDDDDDSSLESSEDEQERALSRLHGEAAEARDGSGSGGKRKRHPQSQGDMEREFANADVGSGRGSAAANSNSNGNDNTDNKRRHPRPTVAVSDLVGPKGFLKLKHDCTAQLSYRGKGTEADYGRHLELQYRNFCHSLCPQMAFHDVLHRIATSLSGKRELASYLTHMRHDVRRDHLVSVYGKLRADAILAHFMADPGSHFGQGAHNSNDTNDNDIHDGNANDSEEAEAMFDEKPQKQVNVNVNDEDPERVIKNVVANNHSARKTILAPLADDSNTDSNSGENDDEEAEATFDDVVIASATHTKDATSSTSALTLSTQQVDVESQRSVDKDHNLQRQHQHDAARATPTATAVATVANVNNTMETPTQVMPFTEEQDFLISHENSKDYNNDEEEDDNEMTCSPFPKTSKIACARWGKEDDESNVNFSNDGDIEDDFDCKEEQEEQQLHLPSTTATTTIIETQSP